MLLPRPHVLLFVCGRGDRAFVGAVTMGLKRRHGQRRCRRGSADERPSENQCEPAVNAEPTWRTPLRRSEAATRSGQSADGGFIADKKTKVYSFPISISA